MTTRDAAVAVIAAHVVAAAVECEQPDPYSFVVVLPGERKLRTTTSFTVGQHTLTVEAFVMRAPEDNVAAVHRWLLERNVHLTMLAYAVDEHGDIYVSGRVPLAAVTDDLIDAILGQVLEAADDPFNLLLELGFTSAIRREWAWRLERGESTANLAAFEALRPPTEGD